MLSPTFASDREKNAFDAAERGDWSEARWIAKSSENAVLIKLIEWQYALDPSSGASFENISRFIQEHPDWPEQKRLRVRAELALRDHDIGDADIIRWFGDSEPLTGYGKFILASAQKHTDSTTKEKLQSLIREAWIHGDFEEAEEKKLLAQFGNMLGEAQHIARASRLLWDEKTAAAKRMLPKLPKDHQRLVEARMALIQNKKLSVFATLKVPDHLKNDPGLIYDRMQYRARKGDDDGVREMLLKAPKDVPYPEKWWKLREMEVRQAIDDGKYNLAEKLLNASGELTGSNQADALWLSGWVQLEFLNNANAAYDLFEKMYASVRFSSSRARAAFWAGRAAEIMKQKSAADDWYEKASAYPTTFYGQLGLFKRHGSVPLHIPSAPDISAESRERFQQNDLTRAAEMCFENQARNLGTKLVHFLIETNDDIEQVTLIANLAAQSGFQHLGVRGAKKAIQKGIVLIETGYPMPAPPEHLAVENALALAITRQESEFDPTAVSPSGARGLMQLLPSTAKETARKADLDFNARKLFQPDYNMTLGSHYLGRMINNYDGSYIMAIAAYNAGPGNVRKWTRSFGTPGNDLENAINWIEKIPFAETRNYVQRVLENLQVYRHIENKEQPPRLMIAEDLVR